MDYLINPVKMGGLVKSVSDDQIKVHLHGRLGVITIPKSMVRQKVDFEPGHEMEFYFSYLQMLENPWEYDSTDMVTSHEITPCLLGGTISEVNDTAIKVTIMNELGTVAVPRRWVFTPSALKEGQSVEFYFSCMNVVGKREMPAEFI